MIKKLSIFMLLFISLIGFANAGTTYLNSCGKNTGWLSGETYILNFTEIPPSYANSWCFFIQSTALNSNQFKGFNQTIINKKTGGFTFLYLRPYNGNKLYELMNFTDFNYKGNGLDNFFILDSSTYGGSNYRYSYFRYNNLNNIKIENINSLFYGIGYAPISQPYVNSNNFSNFELDSNYFFLDVGGYYQFSYNNMINSVFNTHTLFTNVLINLNNFKNSVFINNHSTTSYYASSNNYNDSIIEGYIYTDSDNNNIADSNLDAGVYNSRMSIVLNNKNYLQDITEGKPFIAPYMMNIPINTELLSTSTQFVANDGSGFDPSLMSILGFNSQAGVILSVNSTLDCAFSSCLITDVGSNTNIDPNTFRGWIRVIDNATVINGNYVKSAYFNNNNIISNFVDLTFNNIQINNNNFTKGEERQQVLTTTGSEALIKLKGNKIKINNNTFTGISINSSVTYDLLYIDSVNKNTNIVKNNNFINSGNGSVQIFGVKGDATFYNNNISSNVVISNDISSNVDVNPIIGFKHTDNKIYYYQLGNYYADNTGCVDSTNDGICDSPYVSGNVTDNYPLSSYPFDYTQHLFTTIVPPVTLNSFNISLINITNNQTVILNTLGDTLVFSYNHNSNLPDLTCELFIDGVSKDIQTNVNDTINVPLTGGWTEKLYTHSVTCSNQFVSVNSGEIIFNLLLSSTPIYGCTDNTATNYNPLATVDDGSCVGGSGGGGGNVSTTTPYTSIDVIDYNSVDNTNQNTIGFMQDIMSFITNVGIPAGILVVVIVSVLAVLRLLI